MRRNKRKAVSVLSAALTLAMTVANGAWHPGGGMVVRAANKISISTAAELQNIGQEAGYPLSGDYELVADIDLAGVDFTPIGGGSGTRGASSGDNVFTGTFDGNGHIISNLSISETGNSAKDWQYGMFGIISSDSDTDKASVKNLILTGVDVDVDMSGNGYLSLGVLAGEINCNAEIDNVAIMDGTIVGNPSNSGDVVGVGGLAGEMRYESPNTGGQQAPGTNGVTISNVYVGADVTSGGSKDTNYAAGIVGRIAKTSPSSMEACVYTGNATFKGNSGYGISGGNMTDNISGCYYLSGKGLQNTGAAVSESQLKAGTLLEGLGDSYWTAREASYILPKQCAESEVLEGILALSGISLELAEGDSLSSVTGNFTVPMSVQAGEGTEAVIWSSDKPETVSVGEDGTVTVNEVFADTDCTLTATTASGRTKKFRITVVSKVVLQINQEYAAVGQPLTVSMIGAPQDLHCTYEWAVGGTVKSTGESYTPTKDDLEKMLTVTATADGEYSGTYQASMYVSKLPVLYVETEGGQAITSKENYINGDFRIQGNAQYNTANSTLYDGPIQIRGRGNTTWGYDKKPYKIKLDTKTDIFGFGRNKHWVLLANYTDESHMRNTLAYNLSGEMGMPYMQSVHVDLILNGQYVGTYQFCEQVKIAGDRVNIHDWEDYAGDVAKAVYKAEKEQGLSKDDQDAIETLLAEENMGWMTTGTFTYKNKEYRVADYVDNVPECTGGFLIELDGYYDEYSKFKSSKNQPLQFKSPEFIATNAAAVNYVKNYINAFESAISASDFTTVYNNETVSYSQLFDMDSLVQFWMVNELFMNVDAMKKSTYMYKDTDGLFHMGPIWDMDWSSGSLVSDYQGSGVYNEWQTVKFSDSAQADQWYKSIIQDPYFAVKAYEWYTQMREKMGAIVSDGGTMDTYQELLSESADANGNIWYQWDTNKKFGTQITALKTYLTNRLNWLDVQFESPESLASSLGYKSAGGITVAVEKNGSGESEIITLTADVTGSGIKSVEFLVNGVKAGAVDVADGKAQIEAPASALAPVGSYNTVQVFGLNTNGSVSVSGGNKVTDFEKFFADKPADPTDPDDPDNPGHTHTYEAEVTKPASCTEKGTKTYTCACGETYTEDIEELGHTEVIDEAAAPTETTDGKTEGSHCSVCGTVLREQKVIPATGVPEVPVSQQPLKAPADVNAVQLDASRKVEVTFSVVSGAGEYDIYRSAKAGSGYKKIGSSKNSSYTDKSAKKGKTYYYKIVAKAANAEYNSSLSDKCAIVKVRPWPSVKVKAANGRTVTVSWKKVSGAKGYAVYSSAKKTKGFKLSKTVKKATSAKITLKASGKVKKLYVKTRAFYRENGKKVYGPYSKTIMVNVKK